MVWQRGNSNTKHEMLEANTLGQNAAERKRNCSIHSFHQVLTKEKSSPIYQKQNCKKYTRNPSQNRQENIKTAPVHTRQIQIPRTKWITSQNSEEADKTWSQNHWKISFTDPGAPENYQRTEKMLMWFPSSKKEKEKKKKPIQETCEDSGKESSNGSVNT